MRIPLPIPIPAFVDNYIWSFVNHKEETLDCVDPGEAKPVLDYANKYKLRLRTLLLTHHHQDHIAGVAELLEHYPSCMVYGPQDERIPYPRQIVQSHDLIRIGDQSFQVLFNPGHTSSHISYYQREDAWLFCGDTLFSGGCGRVFDSTIEALHASMLLFKTLATQTRIFSAHEYTEKNLCFAQIVEPKNMSIKEQLQKIQTTACSLPSSLDLELAINPFLRTDIPEVIQYALEHGADSPRSLDVFRVLREQKDRFR
jgi:hydroxyacylglutathione hydrolase